MKGCTHEKCGGKEKAKVNQGGAKGEKHRNVQFKAKNRVGVRSCGGRERGIVPDQRAQNGNDRTVVCREFPDDMQASRYVE